MLKMSTNIKQQPFSPISYSTYSNDFYNNNHHHRQSTTSPENEQLSPPAINTAESSSTSTLVPSSAAGGGGGGWYEKEIVFAFSTLFFMYQCYLKYLFTFNIRHRCFFL